MTEVGFSAEISGVAVVDKPLPELLLVFFTREVGVTGNKVEDLWEAVHPALRWVN